MRFQSHQQHHRGREKRAAQKRQMQLEYLKKFRVHKMKQTSIATFHFILVSYHEA